MRTQEGLVRHSHSISSQHKENIDKVQGNVFSCRVLLTLLVLSSSEEKTEGSIITIRTRDNVKEMSRDSVSSSRGRDGTQDFSNARQMIFQNA